ncbi:MAG: hypothetical protein QNI99_04650 [Woeseiaceae bacterium]|nr:hypothetical protein [Woeseiaceae bacterium]
MLLAALALLCQPVTAYSETLEYPPFAVADHDKGSTWTSVRLEGGHIGSLDLEGIRNGDLSSIVALLQRHSDWTGADHDLDLRVSKLTERDVVLVQRVHGTAVSRHDTRIRFDEHGGVRQLSSLIIHPDAVGNMPTILARDAVEMAKEAVRNHLGRSDATVATIDDPARFGLDDLETGPTLYLKLQGYDEPPQFYWWVLLSARTSERGDWYHVNIDAHSGETTVRREGSR